MSYRVGDYVTLLQPGLEDPLLLTICPHVRIAEKIRGAKTCYVVAAPWTYVTDQWGRPLKDEHGETRPQTFGPFPEDRLAHGWIEDGGGRWLNGRSGTVWA